MKVLCNNKDCENYAENTDGNLLHFGKCRRTIISIYEKGKCGYYFKREE